MKQQVVYQRMVLKGTHFELGRQQGEALRAKCSSYVEWLTSPYELSDGRKVPELTREEADRRCELLNQVDPGLGEEVRGLADGLQIPILRLNKLWFGGLGVNGSTLSPSQGEKREPSETSEKRSSSCSVFGFDGACTTDGHSYIGQSYEFSLEDEFAYIAERAEGSFSHMGFSFYQVGRFDGINENGLCVGITSLDFTQPSAGEKEGFSFAFLVRILLDTCSTTEESLDRLRKLPICTNANIIIGDRAGHIALVEIQTVDGKSDIMVRPASPVTYGFNHYIGDEHKARIPQKRFFSYAREEFMERFLAEKSKKGERLAFDDVKTVLTEKIPNGLCCHAYADYFGTLRSMIYDTTESCVYVAFGSPRDVSYRRLTLEEELAKANGCEALPVEYENEEVDVKFWSMV